MNRLLAENTTTGKYEIITSTGNKLETTGGGVTPLPEGHDVVILGVTDINNPSTTNKNVVVDVAGSVQTKLMNSPMVQGTSNQSDPSNNKAVLLCETGGSLRVGLQGYTDITDSATAVRIKSTALGSISVKQDDHASVVVQGVSNQGNPFGTKLPLLIDTTGKLEVVTVPNITRGEIGGFTGGVATGWDADAFSDAIDMTYHKTIEFHIQSSATGSHEAEIHISNDNTTYVAHQEISLQTVGTTEVFKGSFTSGFRYVKLKNTGSNIASTTYKQYALYN